MIIEVSLATAQMAAAAGYRIYSDKAYYNKGYFPTTYLRRNNVPVEDMLFIPEVHDLQDWLRDSHNIDLWVFKHRHTDDVSYYDYEIFDIKKTCDRYNSYERAMDEALYFACQEVLRKKMDEVRIREINIKAGGK